MPTYIALLRGINVGGNNSLPMKSLTNILQGLGARAVQTYIQSGNAVFQADDLDPAALANRLRAAIKEQAGFAPEVILITRRELEDAIAANPFPADEADPAHLHLGFLSAAPTRPDLARLESLKTASEQYHLDGRVFYLFTPEGAGRSKLAAGSEKALGVSLTNRNWNTVLKLRQMAAGLGD